MQTKSSLSYSVNPAGLHLSLLFGFNKQFVQLLYLAVVSLTPLIRLKKKSKTVGIKKIIKPINTLLAN